MIGNRVLLRQLTSADNVAFCVEVYDLHDAILVAQCCCLHEALLITYYESMRLAARIEICLASDYAEAFEKLQ